MIKSLFLTITLTLLFTACTTESTNTTANNSNVEMASAQAWETVYPAGEIMCSDGSPYSFHVKSGAQDNLFVFLNGGGACWNLQTCDERGELPYLSKPILSCGRLPYHFKF